MKDNKVIHGELEDIYGPPCFTHVGAKGGEESTQEGDDDSLDEMAVAKKSWFVAKQLGCYSEDEEGVLNALAKANKRLGKESKSRKKRKHKRKIEKEV